VIRRLRRVAAAYGTEPRILLASATIANPVELAERLTGLEEFADRARRLALGGAADRDLEPAGDRRGARHRRSALSEAAELLARLVSEGARTICFVRSRKGVELLTRLVALELERLGAGSSPTPSRPTAPATRRPSGARSSGG
jgi:DEAD/DEAH box helicase domain-containing protein